MLFEEKPRISQEPKSYVESDWDYLDRSGRAEAQHVRDFLNYWISQYPFSEQRELIARISSGDNRQFQSAIFELAIFAILKSLGCSITVHPELSNGSTRRPDFLVVTPKGESVYVEAVFAADYSEADIAARKRTDVVLHSLEKIDSPNFFIGVEVNEHPERPPNGKALRTELERWLTALDPDKVAHMVRINGHDAIPKMEWESDGWNITFEAIPKKPERRGKGQRVIGVLSNGVRWTNYWEPIRDAVKAKGNRYGELPHTLLIAINIDDWTIDRIDEMQGLFGQEEYLFGTKDNSAPPIMQRKANGAWYGPKGPQYTRVSGAWIFGSLSPWNIVSRKNTVYFNPWATMPLPLFFTGLPHAKVESEKMNWHEGPPLSKVLGLPAEWPELLR